MEARFEYRFVEINARGRDRIAVRDAVSDHASVGWRLVQILDVGKGSFEIIFERPILDDANASDIAVLIQCPDHKRLPRSRRPDDAPAVSSS